MNRRFLVAGQFVRARRGNVVRQLAAAFPQQAPPLLQIGLGVDGGDDRETGARRDLVQLHAETGMAVLVSGFSVMAVIDADTHVIETQDTWDFLEGNDKRFRPVAVTSDDGKNTPFWLVDGHIIDREIGDETIDLVDVLEIKGD